MRAYVFRFAPGNGHERGDDGHGSDEVGVASHCFAASTANMIMAMTMAHSISGARISIDPSP